MTWIWIKDQNKNGFAEFQLEFLYEGGETTLRIGADYRYAAYIGEHPVSCGQYADLPSHKSINSADITPFVRPGKNRLRVVAWHMGEDFSVCRTMAACVAFEILVEGQCIARSDETTLCRPAFGYRAGDLITPQMGYGFHYDFVRAAETWTPATVVYPGFSEVERPILPTTVGELGVPRIAAQGLFRYRGGETAAEQMQAAWLASLRFWDMTGLERPTQDVLTAPITFRAEGGDGVFAVADMGRETCGHLGFSVTVDKPCRMMVGWGEHLSDLRVRTAVGGRNFGMDIALQAGENVLDDYLLRLGCRYLCLFAETDCVTVSRLGIREVGYPFAFPEKDFGDGLRNAIYETGRRTLYLSAHEHYEDCPWREQALYGMDSRNQMLFGYGAFAEYDYPRANLLLIARAQQANGLIPLTAPAEMGITIPSFTAYWLMAIGENAEADYSEAFAEEILLYAERGLRALLASEGEHGLSLVTDVEGWNFHEWSDGLDGGKIFRSAPLEPAGDALLTALTAIAARKLAALTERMGRAQQARDLRAVADRLAAALEHYYDPDKGLYASYIRDGAKYGYHEYTQATVLVAGDVPETRVERLCEALQAPAAHGLVPSTLSTLQMTYEALLHYGRDPAFCLRQIERVFGSMLLSGATAYWETAIGEADFRDAGSLCHGWSAVCCWVLDQCRSRGLL